MNILVVLGCAVGAWAQTLPAAGDGAHLWLALEAPAEDGGPRIVLLHREGGDEPNELHRVQTLSGRVGPNGMAAAGQRVWIVYPGSNRASVQVVKSEPAAPQSPRVYVSSVRTPLPVGEGLRSFAAASEHAWALLRIESVQMLEGMREALDSDSATAGLPATGVEQVAVPDSADTPASSAQSTQTGPDSDVAAQADTGSVPDAEATGQANPADDAPSMPMDVLLEWSRGAWRQAELPEDWPVGHAARLVALHAAATDPVLVVEIGKKPERQVRVYRREASQWQAVAHPRSEGSSTFEALAVTGQLVLAERSEESDKIAVALSVLRQNEATAIGTLAIDGPADRLWAVASNGDAVALIVQDHALTKTEEESADAPLQWTRMNLLGEVVTPPGDLGIVRVSIYDMAGGSVVFVSVLVLATLMMLLFWRRDPRLNQVTLPDGFALSGFLRRAGAGAIDLAPGVLGVMYFYGIDLEELVTRRPGSAVALTWESMQPGAVVIIVFLLHTIVSECLTERTLGKACVGLRVTRLDGTRPRFWQLLVRGLLKAFDLIAWLLLILPLIGPFRQRLGDMVARTVVVQRAPVDGQDTEETDAE